MCERETEREAKRNFNKPNTILFYTFLLVYDSFTRGFVVTFPYVHILKTGLVLLFHYSPPTPLPFLQYLQQAYVFHVHTWIESASATFTSLFFFVYPLPPTAALLCTTHSAFLSFIV
jgi:hypothetical protein